MALLSYFFLTIFSRTAWISVTTSTTFELCKLSVCCLCEWHPTFEVVVRLGNWMSENMWWCYLYNKLYWKIQRVCIHAWTSLFIFIGAFLMSGRHWHFMFGDKEVKKLFYEHAWMCSIICTTLQSCIRVWTLLIKLLRALKTWTNMLLLLIILYDFRWPWFVLIIILCLDL